MGVAVKSLLAEVADDEEKARLLAAGDKISGAWLHFPLGMRMDDSCLMIAVGLRLGTSISAPHICQHCGAEVSGWGLHGLSCRSSEGRRMRHLPSMTSYTALSSLSCWGPFEVGAPWSSAV